MAHCHFFVVFFWGRVAGHCRALASRLASTEAVLVAASVKQVAFRWFGRGGGVWGAGWALQDTRQ